MSTPLTPCLGSSAPNFPDQQTSTIANKKSAASLTRQNIHSWQMSSDASVSQPLHSTTIQSLSWHACNLPVLLASWPAAPCGVLSVGPGGPLPRLLLSRPAGLCVGALALSVGAGALCRAASGPAELRIRVHHPARSTPSPELRSTRKATCHPSLQLPRPPAMYGAPPARGPPPPPPTRVPPPPTPSNPGPSHPRATHPAWQERKNPKPYCLGDKNTTTHHG